MHWFALRGGAANWFAGLSRAGFAIEPGRSWSDKSPRARCRGDQKFGRCDHPLHPNSTPRLFMRPKGLSSSPLPYSEIVECGASERVIFTCRRQQPPVRRSKRDQVDTIEMAKPATNKSKPIVKALSFSGQLKATMVNKVRPVVIRPKPIQITIALHALARVRSPLSEKPWAFSSLAQGVVCQPRALDFSSCSFPGLPNV